MFSITQNGKPLSPDKYTWDAKNKVLTTSEDNLVLDFTKYNGVTFITGSFCTFKTGWDCTFKTGNNCTFDTGYNCTFNTGGGCTFKTGNICTFNTGDNCTFNTGGICTFNTGDNCFIHPYTKDDFMENLKSGWKHFKVTKDDLLDVLI